MSVGDVFAERNRKIEEKRPAFDRWAGYLHLNIAAPAWARCRDAVWAIREFRYANQSRPGDYEDICLTVRVAADTFATQIESLAGDEQDPATIAWVAAGLRCPQTPFCTGCNACQTVTAPQRPCEPVARRGLL